MNLYIVTGSSRGLGRALCEAIARSPENQLIAMTRQPAAPAAGEVSIAVDLADTGALEEACERIDRHLAGQQYARAVLVNNAGVVEPVAPLDLVDPGELERNLMVNLVAPMLLMRHFVRATEGIAAVRRIINISSGAGRRPIPGWGAYCAAKAGLDMASRVMALEMQARANAVEVVSLAPGVIDTDMQATVRGKDEHAFADVARFRRMKEEGQLRSAAAVAEDILRAEAEGRLAGEAVLDLRSLAG